MKLLFYSTAPWVGTGYGVLTQALVKRMIADGHSVTIGTKHHVGGTLVIGGVTVFDGTEFNLVNKIVEEEGYDYLISAMDDWVMPEPFKKWVSCVFVDTEMMNPKMKKILAGSMHQIAVTKHGEAELKRVGYNPSYAPLGVDTKVFYPSEDKRKLWRSKRGWRPDQFVIGLVGINYGTDRKNIAGTIRAFQGFNKRHPNSVLYLHTDVLGSATGGLPLQWVMACTGFEGTGSGPIQFVDQKAYHLWSISNEELAGFNNAFDVMCLASHGEGFGMPWIEAQACGTPIISADTTSGKELNWSGWVIPKQEDYFKYSTLMTWFVETPPSAIDEHLEMAYKEWESGAILDRRLKAAEGAKDYDWDAVYDKYWRPILKKLQDDLTTKLVINTLPDYQKEFYDKYPGKVLLTECFAVCKDQSCQKCDSSKFHYLPGEIAGQRNIMQISYPLVPTADGGVLVDTGCKLFQWLSPRFISETRSMWKELFAYPEIQRDIQKLWDSGYFSGVYATLEDAAKSIEFNASYAEAMQSNFFTTFVFLPEMLAMVPKGGKVLDIGTGDGNRVRELRGRGFQAIGTEVNQYWINGDTTIYGSIMELPFSDGEFDMVSSIDVLEHISDPKKGIAEMFRISNNAAIIQVTPPSDVTFLEDPTHCVDWSGDRWLRECLEYGTLVKRFTGATFLFKKK
jgi:glycosyltransferase involved in cell wall biosynthesis/SAM-dependent methyltransferase